MNGRDARLDLGIALLIALAAFAALTPLVQRDIGWVDSVELALAGQGLGVPHPTGYPLYALLARLAAAAAARAGFDPAFGVNLLSALFAAVAAALTYGLGRRLGFSVVAAAAAALLLVGARDFIAQATVAEVYTLHLLLVVLLFTLALDAAGSGRALLGAAFVLGLGLAHHLTIVLAVPALAVLLIRRRQAVPRLALGLALALPLTLYLVLLTRSALDPALDLGDPETVPRLLSHVRGRQFGYRLLTSEAAYAWAETGRFFHLLVAQWSPVAIPWIVLGAVVMATGSRLHRRVLAALLLLVAAVVAHAVAYRIPDKEAYYLPVYLVAALLAGALAHVLLVATSRSRHGRAVLAYLVIALSLWPFIGHRHGGDRHADHSLADLALEVGRRTTTGSLILSDDTSVFFALRYLQETGRMPEDRTIVAEYFLPLPWYAASLSALDPALPAEVAAHAADRSGLQGRALGDRLAQDSRELAAGVVRRAVGQRDVFVYFHDFATEATSFAGLALADRGLVYQVEGEDRAERSLPDAEFARFASYRADRRRTAEEGAVARRYAVAANRAGIARVSAGDAGGAEREFRKALILDPDYAQAWLNLGLLRADYLERPAEARAAWQRFLECAPDAPEAPAVRARLGNLAVPGTTGAGSGEGEDEGRE